MPTVKVKSNSQGSANFKYTISTPTSTSAKAIDKSLPTLLFIHPVYIASDIWQPQFGDAQLRRFNLVALDLRVHGETGGKVTSSYRQDDAAEDIVKFMDALKIPSAYLVGLSMGTIIALQVAVTYPERVTGLMLISPLGTEEPEEVAAGRREIYESWKDAFPEKGKIDQETLDFAVRGALELAFNNQETPLTNALVKRLLPQALKLWSRENFDSYETATVKFFTERKSHSQAALSKIQGPVLLIHCSQDVAYELAYTETFLNQLRAASVNVTLKTVDAAHFGCVTHPHTVNPYLHDFVAQHTQVQVPSAPTEVTSPFEAGLVSAGWQKAESDDED